MLTKSAGKRPDTKITMNIFIFNQSIYKYENLTKNERDSFKCVVRGIKKPFVVNGLWQ